MTTAIATWMVVLVGSWQVLQGEITVGTVLVFTSYLSSLYKPVRQLGKVQQLNISGQDVFLGVNDPQPGSANASGFTLAACGPSGSTNKVLTGYSRLIITRGSAYCFLPSLTGLRYLARLPAG